MSVSIILTTTQKPIFDKIMKANKIKVGQDGNLIELDKEVYDKVMSALQDHWFKKSMAEVAGDEEALLHIIGRLAMLGNLFPNVLETEEVAKEMEEENKIGDEKDGE